MSEGDRFDDEPLIASSLSLDLSGSGTRSAAAESGLAIRPEKVPVPTRTLTCMAWTAWSAAVSNSVESEFYEMRVRDPYLFIVGSSRQCDSVTNPRDGRMRDSATCGVSAYGLRCMGMGQGCQRSCADRRGNEDEGTGWRRGGRAG